MDYFFGKNQKKADKAIQQDISNQIKSSLAKQYCQICGKIPSAKLAFGEQVKPAFTCANCELKAVSGNIKKMGQKNLIVNDKFCDILTKELISYQNSQKNNPPEQKKSQDQIQSTVKKLKQISNGINEEYKRMKLTSDTKMNELIKQSDKQNLIFIFEEIPKIVKENKMNQLENGQLLVKKALVNGKGLYFTDEESIQNANNQINQKYNNLKKQSKIKLKELNELIDEINNIEF